MTTVRIKIWMSFVVIALCEVLSSSNTSAETQDEFSTTSYKVARLTSSVYMLEGAGANITALIGDDGVFLVDVDFAGMAPKLLEELKKRGGDVPKYIVNTHFHYDHSGANEVFGNQSIIISATEARKRLSTEQTLWKTQHPPLKKEGLPQITFDDQLVVHMNHETIKIMHLKRGHTDGDSIVILPHEKIASLGDLYFAGMYPIFHPEHGGTLIGVIRNLKKILALIDDDYRVVPGHGPLSYKRDLQNYLKMIISARESVLKGIASGLSVGEIKNKGLGKKWDSYSHGYLSTERWIDLILLDSNLTSHKYSSTKSGDLRGKSL